MLATFTVSGIRAPEFELRFWCFVVVWLWLSSQAFFSLWSKHINSLQLILLLLFSIQFSSVTQSCPTLCHPMDCSTPGFPVHHQLPELTQTHVHWVGDAIQPSHLLLSPSPPAFNLSQYQGLFKWVSSLPQVAKELEFQVLASVLPMNIQNWFPLEWTGLISL